eukprot:20870-Heterococcus_DN1.PRE.2
MMRATASSTALHYDAWQTCASNQSNDGSMQSEHVPGSTAIAQPSSITVLNLRCRCFHMVDAVLLCFLASRPAPAGVSAKILGSTT